MQMTLAYRGRSALSERPAGGATLDFSANAAREAVRFDAALRHPLRFREAVSALHDVVVNDRRFKRRDRGAYDRWKTEQTAREADLRRVVLAEAREEILAQAGAPLPPGFERAHAKLAKRYWAARQTYANYLLRHDFELWRQLMPCDPVVSVAPDRVFFECFSADESSYGCLSVDRADGFGPDADGGAELGTTNVDYSLDLFHGFQALRSYRETRLRVDPAGFGVETADGGDGSAVREEKIDLPPGWLRGFSQIGAAAALPMRRVPLSRECVYNLLAFLKRHRARQSPRALRFELAPGRPPVVVLEPWEVRVVSEGTRCPEDDGPAATVRVWGRDRLLTLARTLPVAESFDVYLLGDGLPSFWVANLGEMRLTLGLSGWTANDWTRASALEDLAPPAEATAGSVGDVAGYLQRARSATFADILRHSGTPDAAHARAALFHLAAAGQVIHDLPGGVYRWRQVMPFLLGAESIGPEPPERAAARELLAAGRVRLESRTLLPDHGGTLILGRVDATPVELLQDADGRLRRGQCPCKYHGRFGLRQGACRHLLAVRLIAARPDAPRVGKRLDDWLSGLSRPAAEGKNAGW